MLYTFATNVMNDSQESSSLQRLRNVPRPRVSTTMGWQPAREASHRVQSALLYVLLWAFWRLSTLLEWLTPRASGRCKSVAPDHVALTGALAGAPDGCLEALVDHAGEAGVRIVTLYDPCAPKDWARKKSFDGSSCDVRVLHGASIVDIARALAGEERISSDGESDSKPPRRGIEAVWEALDNSAGGEPDVLVVVGSSDSGDDARVLAGFPVWQLRLTQIRFAGVRIDRLSSEKFLSMACSATSVAKRFGR